MMLSRTREALRRPDAPEGTTKRRPEDQVAKTRTKKLKYELMPEDWGLEAETTFWTPDDHTPEPPKDQRTDGRRRGRTGVTRTTNPTPQPLVVPPPTLKTLD